MKTLKFFIPAIATFALLLFTSCEKEQSCNLLGNCPEDELVNPANPANPMDDIGARHNQGLAFLESTYRAEITAKNAVSPFEAETYVFGRSAAFAGSDSALHQRLRTLFKMDEKQLLREVDFSDYETILSKVGLDDETHRALSNSLKAIKSIEPGSIEATNAIIMAIKDQERIIKITPNLQNREFALTLLAVLRYSSHYWQENGGGQQSRAKWWQVVLADGCCGAIGFLLGGPAGGVGLGVAASEIVSQLD